jgi:acylphosphatase
MEMENQSKRKRITVTASVKGIERAETALIRLGIESKETFAKSIMMGKSTVNKFFQRQPIQLDSFRRICEGLKLDDWRTVAEIGDVVAQTKSRSTKKTQAAEVDQLAASSLNPLNTSMRSITVTNRENGEVEIEIILEGDIGSISDNFQIVLETLLKTYGGETIVIKDIRSGSVKVAVKGSQEDISRLLDWINSGEFAEIAELPIQAVQILTPHFVNNVDAQTITDLRELLNSNDLRYANFSDSDLSGIQLNNSDLTGANFSDSDLTGANFSDSDLWCADLRGANCRGANLRGADCRGVNFNDADLSDADLSDADLSGAGFYGTTFENAIVKNCQFGSGRGLDELTRRDIRQRGGLVGDELRSRFQIPEL